MELNFNVLLAESHPQQNALIANTLQKVLHFCIKLLFLRFGNRLNISHVSLANFYSFTSFSFSSSRTEESSQGVTTAAFKGCECCGAESSRLVWWVCRDTQLSCKLKAEVCKWPKPGLWSRIKSTFKRHHSGPWKVITLLSHADPTEDFVSGSLATWGQGFRQYGESVSERLNTLGSA